MSEEKLTPWFPAHVRPVRNGEYEVRRRVGGDYPSQTRLVFRSGRWYHTAASSRGRFTGMPALMSVSDGDVWRGLAEPPK